MPEIIDLTQEIYPGMPVFPGLPEVSVTMHVSHEEWDGVTDSATVSPAVNRLEMGEHTGTQVDALNHMGRPFRGQSIETMPLSMFYTEGICLDLSEKGLRALIEPEDLTRALSGAGLALRAGDTVLLYTDHYRRAFDTPDWDHGPGLSADAARWLGAQGIAAFGVETMSPGVRKLSNKDVHRICGEMGFTHYENLINLHELIGRGRFRFIGLPLKIRDGVAGAGGGGVRRLIFAYGGHGGYFNAYVCNPSHSQSSIPHPIAHDPGGLDTAHPVFDRSNRRGVTETRNQHRLALRAVHFLPQDRVQSYLLRVVCAHLFPLCAVV